MADKPIIREVSLISPSPFEVVVCLLRILFKISWTIKTEQVLSSESAVDMVSASRLIQMSPLNKGCMLPIIYTQTSCIDESGNETKAATPTKIMKITINKRSILEYIKTLSACIVLEAI
ncbi:hypothetical protein CCPUN_05700 [Cardinium endosymbiont of Culicoides punctatus]|nr:hypothetical protein CCPUN_05700 [Cardinium endosymbiont of Culicoides punctatus]